jgi:hypothetical protein
VPLGAFFSPISPILTLPPQGKSKRQLLIELEAS